MSAQERGLISLSPVLVRGFGPLLAGSFSCSQQRNLTCALRRVCDGGGKSNALRSRRGCGNSNGHFREGVVGRCWRHDGVQQVQTKSAALKKRQHACIRSGKKSGPWEISNFSRRGRAADRVSNSASGMIGNDATRQAKCVSTVPAA